MLRDPRLRERIKQTLAEQAASEEVHRPPWVGFTREIQAIHAVNVTLTRLLQAVTRNYSIPLPAAPLSTAEEISLEQAELQLADLDDDIASAMKLRKETNDRT
jgi:hypothetical protein